MNELDKVLDKNEKVFWDGKPKFWPFVLTGIIAIQIIGLFFLIPSIIFIIIVFSTSNTEIANLGFAVFLFPQLWIGVFLVFGPLIYKTLLHKRIHYAITNKRVILQKGLIGRDFEMVDFDQITNAEVNVGIIDKLFGNGSGSILISTAGTFTYGRRGIAHKPYIISNVENPYEVFKFFKKVSHAVKTDINFHNKFRPKTNPGYDTDYK